MEQHKWEKAWDDKKFVIKTLIPSVLVSSYEKDLRPGDRILDIGCGNGRNSLYLAERGYDIDCFDVTNLDLKRNLPNDLKEKIHFKKSSVLEYTYKASWYRVVIVARVIQYFNLEELNFLIDRIKYCLKPDGFLLLSYNTKGGIFNRKDIDVPTHSYPIEQIEALLKTIFRSVKITIGSKKNEHVNYVDDILSFDIYASELY